MANKFLPFVVEKSSALNIYQTLISRSKGLPTEIVASVLLIVISKGITEVREYTNTLPDLSTEQLYSEIVSRYSSYRISMENLNLFLALRPYFYHIKYIDRMTKELGDYELKDILIFLLVMTLKGKEDVEQYTDYKFFEMLTTRSVVIGNLPLYISFSDTGSKRITVRNEVDLEAFILFTTFMQDSDEDLTYRLTVNPHYKAILLPTGQESDV